MDYISKSEFRGMVQRQFAAIQDFKWSEPIPLINWQSDIPSEPGVLILINNDSDNEIIYISASNDLARRLDELLNKSEGRFDDATHIQFALEEEQNIRFGKKADFKNVLKMALIGEDNISNVLEDDDPRIIQKEKEIAEIIQKSITSKP